MTRIQNAAMLITLATNQVVAQKIECTSAENPEIFAKLLKISPSGFNGPSCTSIDDECQVSKECGEFVELIVKLLKALNDEPCELSPLKKLYEDQLKKCQNNFSSTVKYLATSFG